jgi:hypothetical protein
LPGVNAGLRSVLWKSQPRRARPTFCTPLPPPLHRRPRPSSPRPAQPRPRMHISPTTQLMHYGIWLPSTSHGKGGLNGVPRPKSGASRRRARERASTSRLVTCSPAPRRQSRRQRSAGRDAVQLTLRQKLAEATNVVTSTMLCSPTMSSTLWTSALGSCAQ